MQVATTWMSDNVLNGEVTDPPAVNEGGQIHGGRKKMRTA